MSFVKVFSDALKSSHFAPRDPFGFSFIGQPEHQTWSHFELLNHKNQLGAILLTVKGDQAKNFGYECLESLKIQLPLSAEKLYRSLELLLQKAQVARCRLEFALVLTEGRKLILASWAGGVYLERSQKRGGLIKPLEKLQFLLGNRYPNDRFWLYTAGAKKIIFSLHQQLKAPADLEKINNLLSAATVSADQAVGLLLLNQKLFDELYDFFGESQTTNLLSTTLGPKKIEVTNIKDSEKLPAKEKPRKLVSIKLPSPARLFTTFFGSIIQRLTSVFSFRPTLPKFKTRQISWWFGLNKVYLDKNVGRKTINKIGLFLLLGALVLGVLISLFYKQFQTRAQIDTLLQPHKEKLQNLTNSGSDQPVLAKKQAGDLLKDLIAEKSEVDITEYGKNQLEALTQEVEDYLLKIEQREFKDIPVFDDLRKFSSVFITTQAAGTENTAVFADDQQQLLIFYDLASKSGELVTLESPLALKAAAVTASQKIVLAQGLIQLNQVDGKTILKTLVSEGESNKDGTLLAEFKTNLYVFNPSKRNVFRYIEQGTQYSQPVGWFAQSPSLDFSSVVSMLVDGDLWLGTKKGEILKFSGGKQVEFVLADLPTPLHSAIQLATAPDDDYLYVLEPAENRVVVLDKQGRFITQVASPLLGSATRLIFSQSQQLLLAVSGSILYQIPM